MRSFLEPKRVPKKTARNLSAYVLERGRTLCSFWRGGLLWLLLLRENVLMYNGLVATLAQPPHYM